VGEDRDRASRRAALADEGARLAEDRARADGAAADAAAALAAALAAAGAALGADAAALAARLDARDRLDAAVAAERRRLAEQAGDEPEAALRAALAETGPDALAARIAARRADLDAAQTAREAAAAALEATRATARGLLAGPDAAVARQRMRDATAAMAAAAEEWATLKAATLLLGGATRAYAAANRDPVLARGGALFAAMTGGAWAGLEPALGEDDRERLVAVGAGGARVGVEALSEGARDQLFLALRLAAVERRAAEREPLPIVADDLFASFDDARAEAGLAALAEVGRVAQALAFTHHRAVAEAARRLGAPVVAL
jgi:uncharacterized protein YhaN